MAANEIIIRGLDQFYGRRQALRGISLTIRRGCSAFSDATARERPL